MKSSQWTLRHGDFGTWGSSDGRSTSSNRGKSRSRRPIACHANGHKRNRLTPRLTQIGHRCSLRRRARREEGLMLDLRDLFQWERFITPSIIKVFYWLAVGLSVLFGLSGLFTGLADDGGEPVRRPAHGGGQSLIGVLIGDRCGAHRGGIRADHVPHQRASRRHPQSRHGRGIVRACSCDPRAAQSQTGNASRRRRRRRSPCPRAASCRRRCAPASPPQPT